MRRDFLQVRVKSVFPLGHCQEMPGGQRFTALPSSLAALLERAAAAAHRVQQQIWPTSPWPTFGRLQLNDHHTFPSWLSGQAQKAPSKTGPAQQRKLPMSFHLGSSRALGPGHFTVIPNKARKNWTTLDFLQIFFWIKHFFGVKIVTQISEKICEFRIFDNIFLAWKLLQRLQRNSWKCDNFEFW